MNRPPLLAIACSLALTGCGRTGAPSPTFDVPAEVGQVVLVTARAGAIRAEVWCYERQRGGWHEAFPAMPAVVGRSGLIAGELKREGDGHTPAGTYPLGPAFGYAARIDTKLDYRQATAADLWVDDPDSPEYNQCVTAPTKAKSFERMKRDDDLYKLGAVIGYNTAPVIPGCGSAIFLHIWSGPDRPTAGCVAIAETDLAAVLQWLEREKNPVMTIRVHK